MQQVYRFSIAYLVSAFVIASGLQAQAIYNGGNGDGFSINSVVQPNNVLLDIYKGGTEDGFAITSFAQPSNPLVDIYKGGIEDGFAISSYAQASNVLYDIYNGGIEDGFALSSFAQASNILYDIYNGGIEDGFALSSFAQASNVLYDIYNGGIEDGFAVNSFMQASNVLYDIYQGGIEDGFALNTFAQANNVLYDIYNGGIADGFAWNRLGSIGGEVPLPVTLVGFVARYQNGQVLVQWKTASEVNSDYFLLERSRNGIQFVSLFKVTGAGTSPVAHDYSFADEAPFPGLNYYRLKQVDFNAAFVYSSIISVNAEGKWELAMHIFPNPSENVSAMHIELRGVDEGTPVDLSITNMVGEKVLQYAATTGPNGLITLPPELMAGLANGVYLVSARFGSGQLTSKWIVK